MLITIYCRDYQSQSRPLYQIHPEPGYIPVRVNLPKGFSLKLPDGVFYQEGNPNPWVLWEEQGLPALVSNDHDMGASVTQILQLVFTETSSENLPGKLECSSCTKKKRHCLECYIDKVSENSFGTVEFQRKQLKQLARSLPEITPLVLNTISPLDCILIGYSTGSNGRTGVLLDMQGQLYILWGSGYRLLQWGYVRGQSNLSEGWRRTYQQMYNNPEEEIDAEKKEVEKNA